MLAVVGLAMCVGGCPQVGELPATLDVVLPGGVKETAAAGSGPAGLANTVWAGFRKAEEGEAPTDESATPGPYGGLLNGGQLARPPADTQLFLVHFGDGGRITGVSENTSFLPEFYGPDLTIDGQPHATLLPGIFYSAASFGVTIGDKYGLAIAARVEFLGNYVGSAVLYSWGTVAGDRIDGKFGYLLDLTGGLGEPFLKTGGDQYGFYATRK